MPIHVRDAVQERWDFCLREFPSWGKCASVFASRGDPRDGDLFKTSLGLVWQYYRKQMSGDGNKSNLVLIAPPYRREEILECVVKNLVCSEMAPAEFMSPSEIRRAWETQRQVILCFRRKSGTLRKVAYTPKKEDVSNGRYSYRYGNAGRAWFDAERIIALNPGARRQDGRISSPDHCLRGRDEKLFGEFGLLRLNRAIIIVGNKCGETISLLKRLVVGGKSVWDAFSAIELTGDGSSRQSAVGNGIPSIIVANDYERLGPYLESTEGRYDKFHCVIYDDNEQSKEPGTDGMTDQVVIRSSETVIKNLFDDPASFEGIYERCRNNGCLFVWDRHLDAELRGRGCERMVVSVQHARHADIWSRLPHKISALRKRIDMLRDEKIFPVICWVYKQMHLPRFDVQECVEALAACDANELPASEIIEDLKVLLGDYPNGETEKMGAIKQFLEQSVRPDWTVRVLSRTEDPTVTSLIRFGQALSIPRNAERVSVPCNAPAHTIAYRKMSVIAANRYWLFDMPNTNIHWFLYPSEIDSLNAYGDFLDDLQTRHVAPRSYRAMILGVADESLYEYVPDVSVAKEESGSDRTGVVASMDELPRECPLNDSIARFLARDVLARVHDNRREISKVSRGVRILFEDNTRASYARTKVLVIDGAKRAEVNASEIGPGQKVFLIRPEMARLRAENLYGSPDKAAERWRSILRRLINQSSHLDYLAAKITGLTKPMGLNRSVSQNDLRRYGAISDVATELPYNSASKAAVLFRAIGTVGEDDELADEQYARGLAGVIQDAHSKNRTRGRGYMEALRRDWLAGNEEVSVCFTEKTVIESYEIDADDILTEE